MHPQIDGRINPEMPAVGFLEMVDRTNKLYRNGALARLADPRPVVGQLPIAQIPDGAIATAHGLRQQIFGGYEAVPSVPDKIGHDVARYVRSNAGFLVAGGQKLSG